VTINTKHEPSEEQINIMNYEKVAALLPIPQNRKSGTPENARWFMRTEYLPLSRDKEHAKAANLLLTACKKIA